MPPNELSGPDPAGRPQDRLDLTELEAIHGELPIDPIPGLDGG